MFKLLTISLISLFGMNYANHSRNNILYRPSVPTVYGGTSYDEISDGFYIPEEFQRFSYDGPQLGANQFYHFSYSFTFTANYLYFKTYNQYESFYDVRDLEFYNSISYYSMALYMDYNDDSFSWSISAYDNNDSLLLRQNICYYSFDTSNDLNGLEVFYENLEHFVFYVSNFQFLEYDDHNFTGYSGSSVITVTTPYQNKQLPLFVDRRYHSLERYFYFPYQPNVYGYWYKTNDTYWIPALGEVSSYSRPTIFSGLFKNQGSYYSKYYFLGLNNEQGTSQSQRWFFGSYGNISNLSQAIAPAPGEQFWFSMNGIYETINGGAVPVWYVLTTAVTTSTTTNNVISNTYQWYSSYYQEIYLLYELTDTSGNLTSISNLSYYDMLSFNTGFISNPTIDNDPFGSAITLLGIAFQRVWNIGNIVLFGTITLNTLIIVPLLISIVIFILHLVKKG